MQAKIFSFPQIAQNLPSEVKKLFEIFGADIRLVGGSVRDLLLEKNVKDFDFAIRILPDEVIKILEKNEITAVPTGIKYGTVTAVINDKNFEITTLRKDQNQQGRHTDVEFVDDFYEDAARRDFTINALYMDLKGEVMDYFDGISDLKKSKVRFIGDAQKRIEEDFLRILRFFRFTCEYAKTIDNTGLKACLIKKENLKKLSVERIRQEFLKLLSTSKTAKLFKILQLLKSKKITDEIFSNSPDIKALKRLYKIEKSASNALKIAVLFINKKTNFEKLFLEICATNDEKKFLRFLQANAPTLDLEGLKQLLAFYEKEIVRDLYIFSLSKKLFARPINLKFLNEFSLPQFPITSQDLIELGFKDKALGEAIALAKKNWAKNNFSATKNFLIEDVKKTSDRK